MNRHFRFRCLRPIKFTRREMNARHFAIISMAVVMLAVAATFIFTKPQMLRRACGDPHNFSSLLSRITGRRFDSTHCCYAGSMIARLKQIEGAMETYRIEKGAYPSSFDLLTNYITDARFPQYRLQSERKTLDGDSTAAPRSSRPLSTGGRRGPPLLQPCGTCYH